ncbi:MAG: LemA family protein [Verrucomicrobia bacterium]|nr:LemA family protein [Verrucomicrobiota bacterium]
MKALVIIIVILLVVGAVFAFTYVGKYNGLVNRHENSNEGRSKFAAAVNTCSQKMKSVWTLADQEGLLEQETYIGVAQARTAYEGARKAFEAADADKTTSTLDLTKLGAEFGRSLVNVRVAFEAYPQLRTSDTYQKAMAAVEEGFNEIKTALDDWITLCRQYNTYRRSFVTNWFTKQFGWDFPEKIAYYEGGITEPEQVKVTADDINPRTDAPNQ